MKRNPDMFPRKYAPTHVKQTRVRPEEEAAIRDHYNAFKSNITQTAKAFKRSVATVNKILSKQRVPA
jgi:DNA invertase Pin-like site-specific DNA recombinase